MSSLVTYENQSPEYINAGDHVVDSFGRDFIAQTNAEKDQFGYVNVRDASMRWIAYEINDRVSLTYDESLYAEV